MKLNNQTITCRGTVRKILTNEQSQAKKVALKEMRNDFGYGNIYSYILRLPIKKQLLSIPKIEVYSLDELTNKKIIYQSNSPEVSRNYNNYWYNDTN